MESWRANWDLKSGGQGQSYWEANLWVQGSRKWEGTVTGTARAARGDRPQQGPKTPESRQWKGQQVEEKRARSNLCQGHAGLWGAAWGLLDFYCEGGGMPLELWGGERQDLISMSRSTLPLVWRVDWKGCGWQQGGLWGVGCGINPHEVGCGLGQSGGGEGDKGSGCIWKADLIEFADTLDAGCERKQQVKMTQNFGPNSWKRKERWGRLGEGRFGSRSEVRDKGFLIPPFVKNQGCSQEFLNRDTDTQTHRRTDTQRHRHTASLPAESSWQVPGS